jgi:hypothetical protein
MMAGNEPGSSTGNLTSSNCRYFTGAAGHSVIILKAMGGAAGRVPAAATPFWYRDAVHSLEFHAQWAPDDVPGRHIAWAGAARPAARSASAGGGYVNFIGAEDPGRVGAADAGRGWHGGPAAWRERCRGHARPAAAAPATSGLGAGAC